MSEQERLAVADRLRDTPVFRYHAEGLADEPEVFLEHRSESRQELSIATTAGAVQDEQWCVLL
ncbi:MAG: hypothetical protein P8Y29_04295 [Gemmatimonadota bacterium]